MMGVLNFRAVTCSTLVLTLGACGGPSDRGKSPSDTGPSPSEVDLPSGAVVLDHVAVVDVDRQLADRAVVLVSDEVYAVLEAGGPWPPHAQVHDLPGHTVLPGLIDTHVHLFLDGTIATVPDHLLDNLSAQLAWGVVGVADLGASTAVYALRDRIERGEVEGPRIWATGPFVTVPGAHPCEAVHDPHHCRFIEEEGDGARFVAGDLAAADGIKLAVADAAFTPWPTPRIDAADIAEVAAAAHADGRLVVAHVDTPDDVADALDQGVDLLAHPPFDAPGAPVVSAPTTSTLSAFAGTPDLLDGDLLDDDLRSTPADVRAEWAAVADAPSAYLSAAWRSESVSWQTAAQANVAAAIAAKAPVLAGSDAGYLFVPHGLGLHRELEALVDAGMTPLEAIAAATAAPADLLGWTDLGRVDAGYRADLLVVAGDPTVDIRATRAIHSVWLAGVAVEPRAAEVRVTGDGGACLSASDCPPGEGCDRFAHTCQPLCAAAFDPFACGPSTACLPADLLEEEPPVCVELEDCDLIAQDCAPEWYGDNCVPVDLDTNRCWPSGPRLPGETCAWDDPALFCARGGFCSQLDGTCYALCDPTDPAACAGCTEVSVDGEGWFGLCL